MTRTTRHRVATGALALAAALTAAARDASAVIVLVDFGSVTLSPSPDANGNRWNNFSVGGSNVALVDTAGSPVLGAGGSQYGLTFTTGVSFSGGTGASSPVAASLGSLAIASATTDSVFTTDANNGSTFKFTFLRPDFRYTLEIYGARDAADPARTSRYTVTSGDGIGGSTSASLDLQTSGTALGGAGFNYNRSNLAVFSDLRPTPGNELLVNYKVASGGFAYVNAVRLTGTIIPEPTALGLLAPAILVLRRTRR